MAHQAALQTDHRDHPVHQGDSRTIRPAHQDPLVGSQISHLALLEALQASRVNHGVCPIPITSSSRQPLLRETATLMPPNPISSWVRTLKSFGPSSQHASWSLTTSHRSSGTIVNVSC